MLLAFLLAAAAEALVFTVKPIADIRLPVLLLVSLLVIRNGWLGRKQTLVFTAIGAYIVDSMAALEPGIVMVSILLGVVVAVVAKERLEWRARLFVPLSLSLQQSVLWFGSGGGVNRTLFFAVVATTVFSLAVYAGLLFGISRLEARFT